MVRRFVLSVIICLCFFHNSIAAVLQPKDTSVNCRGGINGIYFIGYIWAHHSKMEALYEHQVWGLELNYAIQTNGKSSWESFYNYPEYGLSASFFNFGNPTDLGYGIALQPYISFPFFAPNSWGNIYFKTEIGLGYVTKPYRRFSNYKNVAIGSHLNAAAKFEVYATLNVSKDWLINIGLGLSHMSNGSTNNPNAGLNIPNFNIGTSYRFNNDVSYRKYERSSYRGTLEYTPYIGLSIKDLFPEGDGHYPVYTFSNELYKPLNPNFGVTLTGDFIYDESAYHYFKSIGEDVRKKELFRVGITAGALLKFNKVAATIQMGANVFAPKCPVGTIYQRLGIRYNILPKTFLQVALRTNWFNADCIEYSLGYKIVGK